MNGYTFADWIVPPVYDKHKLGFDITKMTFDQAIDLVKATLGEGYRITHADNDRSSFQFMQYRDGTGKSGVMNEGINVSWVCSKQYN